MKVAARGLCLFVLLGACDTDPTRTASPGAPPRPNVLIVVTDDHRAGDLSAMDQTRAFFGSEGVRFAHAVAATPQCCPARASIFSGRYAHNHGVKSNDPTAARRLEARNTMQSVLQDSGYTTAIVGKYLNGWIADPPNFDRWAIFLRGYRGREFNVDGDTVTAPYSTAFIERTALRFLADLERDDRTPWMLVVAPYAPHLTSGDNRAEQVASRYRGTRVEPLSIDPAMRERDRSDKPAFVRSAPSDAAALAPSMAKRQRRSLLSVDDMIGAIARRLRALDESDDTIAFFVADNGLLLGEHGLVGKDVPYDPAVRIPFYVRWPGHLEGGRIERSRVVANIDIAPTVYEAADVEPPYPVDGEDLMTSGRSVVLLEYFASSRRAYIPSWEARWTPTTVYVRYASGEREYYAPDDPWQINNVYGDEVSGNEPLRARRWDRWLRRATGCSGPSCP